MSGRRRSLQDVPATGHADRGLASQLDFLTSMVIRIVVFGLLLTMGIAILHGEVATDLTNRVVAERAAARLADDLLVTTPGDALLNATCTRAFFARAATTCGVDPDWTSGSDDYPNAALAIDPVRTVNVTITDDAGAIASLSNTRLALGPRVPEQSPSLRRWHRQVALKVGDTLEWYRLTVTVWGRP